MSYQLGLTPPMRWLTHGACNMKGRVAEIDSGAFLRSLDFARDDIPSGNRRFTQCHLACQFGVELGDEFRGDAFHVAWGEEIVFE